MRKDLEKLPPEEKRRLAQELMGAADDDEAEDPPWFDGKKVNQVAYCQCLMAEKEMRCIGHRLYTFDGIVDEGELQRRIAEDLTPYVTSSLDKASDTILKTIKVLCMSKPIPPTEDKIHFQNGTFSLKDGFTDQREWTMNRLPISYDPAAPPPSRWLQYLSELLYEEDIVTLQEFLGYILIATNRGQSMLLLIGSGGEGKSRITGVLQTMFGPNMNIGDIYKLEHDKFMPANQEGRLLFVDDDLKMEALSSTNTIKAIVTCEGMMDLEVKNKQSRQGLMYARLICLGNGTLKALHDKSNGFYRRQIIIQTKNKPKDRVDDPYLRERLEAEIPGILLWCIEGLRRLIANNYRFTISDRSAKIKKELMAEDNNIQAFLESTGYISFEQGAQTTTRQLYSVYKKWCYDNAEKASAMTTFSRFLGQQAEELGILPNKNIKLDLTRRARGYDGIRAVVDGFMEIQDDDDCPFP